MGKRIASKALRFNNAFRTSILGLATSTLYYMDCYTDFKLLYLGKGCLNRAGELLEGQQRAG